MSSRTEDTIHREYLRHGKLAVSAKPSERNAHTYIADALQHTLEDISEYGYSLVWGKDCAARAWAHKVSP
jgi:hypothetical protein